MGEKALFEILVIDESGAEDLYRKPLEEISKEAGSRFTVFRSKDIAIEHTDAVIYDGVIHILVPGPDVQSGLEFSDFTRHRYSGRNFGTIMLGDVDPETARGMGVYETIGCPVETNALRETLDRLYTSMLFRAVPEKMPLDLETDVRVIRDKQNLHRYFRLRYDVWEIMGYLEIDRRNGSRLEIDPYDNFSVPFGCFLENGELVALLRFITSERNIECADMIRELVDEANDTVLRRVISTTPKARIHPEESYEISGLIDSFESEGYGVCELSRTVIHPNYRGYGLSRKVMEFGIAYALAAGYPIAFGACRPEHLSFYQRFGYDEIPGIGLSVERLVQQVAYPVVADFRNLPEPARTNVDRIRQGM